jgi:hypothetical protein
VSFVTNQMCARVHTRANLWRRIDGASAPRQPFCVGKLRAAAHTTSEGGAPGGEAAGMRRSRRGHVRASTKSRCDGVLSRRTPESCALEATAALRPCRCREERCRGVYEDTIPRRSSSRWSANSFCGVSTVFVGLAAVLRFVVRGVGNRRRLRAAAMTWVRMECRSCSDVPHSRVYWHDSQKSMLRLRSRLRETGRNLLSLAALPCQIITTITCSIRVVWCRDRRTPSVVAQHAARRPRHRHTASFDFVVPCSATPSPSHGRCTYST